MSPRTAWRKVAIGPSGLSRDARKFRASAEMFGVYASAQICRDEDRSLAETQAIMREAMRGMRVVFDAKLEPWAWVAVGGLMAEPK